jgi:hypothetical protein
LSDGDLYARIIDLAVDELAAGGIGSYQFSAEYPGIAGESWVAPFSIVNRRQSGDIVYYFWQKIDGPVPSIVRPIKWSAALSGLQEMSDADIESLVPYLQQRIVDTGQGQYSFGSSAPATGTWVSAGSGSDTVQIESESSYSGTYRGTVPYRRTIGYVSTYRSRLTYNATYRARIGYVSTYGAFSGWTFYRFADYVRAYYRFADYNGPTYYRFANYFRFADYTGSYVSNTIQSGHTTVNNYTLWRRTA